MRSDFETPYLAWSRPADEPTNSSDPLTIETLEQDWQANAEALRRRRLLRLVPATPQQAPLSVA